MDQKHPWREAGEHFFDLLHVVWLGIARDHAASLMAEIWLDQGGLWPNASDAFAALTLSFQKWCKDRKINATKHSFTPASLSFSAGSFAAMGSYFKGMHVKTICTWLAFEMQERYDGSLFLG